MIIFVNILGLFGVAFILVAYLLFQIEYLKSIFWFSLYNMIGSLLILVSLYHEWNTPSVVVEIAWFFISLYGVLKKS